MKRKMIWVLLCLMFLASCQNNQKTQDSDTTIKQEQSDSTNLIVGNDSTIYNLRVNPEFIEKMLLEYADGKISHNRYYKIVDEDEDLYNLFIQIIGTSEHLKSEYQGMMRRVTFRFPKRGGKLVMSIYGITDGITLGELMIRRPHQRMKTIDFKTRLEAEDSVMICSRGVLSDVNEQAIK